MDQKSCGREISEPEKNEKFRNFRRKFFSDLRNKENWKLKIVYFLLITGIVIIWAQITVHQSSLNLSHRDTADFVAVSSILGMFVPFLAGVIADKIGNYTYLVSGLMILMGINSFLFITVPPVDMIPVPCDKNSTITFILNNNHQSPFINLSDTEIALAASQIKYCTSNFSESISQASEQNANNWMKINCSRVMESAFQYETYKTALEENCNQTTPEISSYKFTYWSYMAVRTSFMIFTSSSFTLFEGTVMVMSRESNTDFGLQRAWGTLAGLLSAYIGGKVVDLYSIGKEVKDYSLIFIISGVSCILSGMVASCINMRFKLPTARISAKILSHILKFEILTLLVIILLKGAIIGYVETFMYIYMSRMGASATLIGLTVTVGAALEIVLQLFATPIIRAFGQPNVISFAVFLNFIRCAGFSYTYDPRVMLGLEVLDAWANGFSSTAINVYCSSLVSAEVLTSLRGIIGVLHDGFGKFFSAKIGIVIQEIYGERNAWRIVALFALFSSLGYSFVMYFQYALKKLKITREKYSLNGRSKNERSSGRVNKGFQI